MKHCFYIIHITLNFKNNLCHINKNQISSSVFSSVNRALAVKSYHQLINTAIRIMITSSM